jgi:arsenate reductase
MAEAFLNSLAGHTYEAMSAGLEPGEINPLAVEAIREIGIDISQNKTKSAFDLYQRGELFSYVIAVCDARAAQRCPNFPGLLTKTINWNIEDPAASKGTREEKLEEMRRVRNIIKQKVEAFIREFE